MLGTTPLAPWMTVRNLFVFAILLATTACGSKQYSSRQNLADTEKSTASIAEAFEPTSPFLHFSNGQFCTLPVPGAISGASNPFELSFKGPKNQQQLVALAFSQIGTLYRPGGVEPGTGFDCSGFTTWVYGKLGVNLPRSSREQFQEGKVIPKSQLKKGDLVFFGNKKRITHVGIYLEDNKFIHSSSSGDTVKISSLDEPTWERKYTGARRVF
ncbi:Murein DD-endopeptidase MepH [Fundidesulfovibrio magnetotacticus]|uniref:Murein DD-endopeptidase MepH n=1 Tax=Fundidesulfovibrio magnetotacticus TaxID=2730080 RepID=A0A6V8M3I3_9BACT|nr:C40 family peptidase [Fundidesulfovibrio magnetotacticus]GFK95025.1 Murein DD-endopeptidase MepH [Fundidesulfovibrio magnetotacticus]